ncbi:unnamed protein product [Ambrosiozyma monospora]|uniref:Unnamed protein product n=1 Tax=Ambrosiozyma monospora TaxID=43982 RepID=A0ACB5T909_AMBMO|nr:unnamed protein product [Ambrosiozyma monospora]
MSSSVEQKNSQTHELNELISESSSDPNYPQQYNNVPVDHYDEGNVDLWTYLKVLVPNPLKTGLHYLRTLFPILGWIAHYPVTPYWVYSDFVAGVTVAIVMVPQSMSYAQIATLAPQYGLYSSFTGVLIYAFFATSKDVSIGPVAVMSMEVGKIITEMNEKYPGVYEGHVIGTTLALLCGAIALGIGLLRLGFLLELIPLPAVLAFMSGSAMNIMAGQVPALMELA